jgi:hypothetical protein
LPGRFQLVISGPPSRTYWLLLAELANDAAGITGRKNIGGDAAGDDAAGTDDRAVADRHGGTDNRAAADPDVAADLDGLAELLRAPELVLHGCVAV